MVLIKRFIWLLREGAGLHWEIIPCNEEVLFCSVFWEMGVFLGQTLSPSPFKE